MNNSIPSFDYESVSVLEKVIEETATICYHISSVHGFHEDHEAVKRAVSSSEDLSKWLESTTEQAEIARMHSELSEWLEGIRKDPNTPDNHLPQFSSSVVEAADCIIRILDTCAKRNYPIGAALVAKIHFNNSRPYKHGKNS